MIALRSVTVLLLTATLAAAAARESPRVVHERQLAAADSLANAGAWQAAVDSAEVPLADDGLDPDLRWRCHQIAGLGLQRLGHPQRALAHLEQAVVWGQTVAVNHRNLATLLMELGRPGRALSEYRQACDLAPSDPAVRLEYGQALLRFGQRDAAADAFREAESSGADPVAAARAWSGLYLAAGDYASALPYLEKLNDAAPDAEIAQQLALARLRCGEPEGARALLAPRWRNGLDTQGMRILLEADRAVGDPGRALSLALSPVAADRDDPQLWALAALICMDAGRDSAALALEERALALTPDATDLRRNRVILLDRLGRKAEAARERARLPGGEER